ncbi:hypothetical protein SPRG_13214 [Saprolegnia parasitica CBS 223.65]|uniref:Transmembrane protein n=1 Tax=Saprolegnia parasitica (strain CBS 223.65) TaxID=695850 RepID=A0A067BSU3_SAPPC|nr:hypothetical protein SPRG_13214 [Saprolegnia parasitica CBS 223.65]KDO21323.1 hypothetical protein SPRG_13214 [Saprolegnia parasitica CBS 223.65]|eukprot:XP_012207978.1 hypothetical protein SPRG_13214 [Saprolegnia parasitica CBS 223.65]
MRSLLTGSSASLDEDYSGYSDDKTVLGRGLLSDSVTPTSYYQSSRHLKMLAVTVLIVCVGLVPFVAWPSRVELSSPPPSLRSELSSPANQGLSAVTSAPLDEVKPQTVAATATTTTREPDHSETYAPPTTAPSTTHVVVATVAPKAPVSTQTTHLVHHGKPYPDECAAEVSALHPGDHFVLEHASEACKAAPSKSTGEEETATVQEEAETAHVGSAASHNASTKDVKFDAEEMAKKLQAMEHEMELLRLRLADDEAAIAAESPATIP